MAIAFNLPNNEDTDARYELLNRLLLELCELLQTIVAARNADNLSPRVRPVSDSSVPRVPDLLLHARSQRPRRRICSVQTPPASPSCSSQYLSRTFSDAFDANDSADHEHSIDYFGDDDEVFCSNANLAPPNSNRMLLPRPRRRRRKSVGARDAKRNSYNQPDNEPTERRPADIIVEAPPPPIVLPPEENKDGSLMSALLSTSLGGPIWTAVVIVLGWKLLGTTKR